MPFVFSLGGSNDNFRDGMFEMEIGNDIDELRNDDRVKFILQLSDSDDNSSESGFSEVSHGHLIGQSDQQGCVLGPILVIIYIIDLEEGNNEQTI